MIKPQFLNGIIAKQTDSQVQLILDSNIETKFWVFPAFTIEKPWKTFLKEF
jgi:hypothetical protein